jgi:hypothetical protein
VLGDLVVHHFVAVMDLSGVLDTVLPCQVLSLGPHPTLTSTWTAMVNRVDTRAKIFPS